MEAVKKKLSTTGIAVRFQRDNSNHKKGILRLESAAGADGPVETLILNQVIEDGRIKQRLVEGQQSRIDLKDVMGAFGSEGSMSGLDKEMKEKAIVLLAATRSKRNRRVKLAPLRFTIDDDTVSLTRVEIMKFLCSGKDAANGVLTNILPTEGVAMAGSTITFFSDNFTGDGMVGTLTKMDLILQVSEQLFDVGKWAGGVVAPVFAVFASIVSRFETMQGLKSDFIDLLERLSNVEGNLPDEQSLKSHMLGLAEDFFFMSGVRKYFASKDFQGNLTRLMGRMDRAVQGQTLRHAAKSNEMLETIDTKVDTLLRQSSASKADEKEFDWTCVKSMLPQSRLFLGREDELRTIREHVERPLSITALVGVAGCGKSHLASEVADQWSRDAPEKEHRIVLFASVANEESYVSYLLRIMMKIGLEPISQEDGRPIPTAELSRRIHRRLAEAPSNVEVLWILDNAPVSADGPDLLSEWFGPEESRSWSNLRVILTSQSRAYSFTTSLGEIEMVPVTPLPTDVSLDLLTKTFPRLQEQEDEKKAATELVVEYLHNLPVAILAVAPLAQKWTFCGYLRRLREKKVTAGVDSVREVLQDALEEARQDPSLARVLDVAAFVSPDNISLSLLGNDEGHVEQLCMLNLLQVVMDEHYSMHGLIQAAAQVDRSPRDGIVTLAVAFQPYQDESPDTWQAAVALLPHFEGLHRVASVEYVLVELSSDDLKVYGGLLNNCGMVYNTVLCKLEQSRMLYEESLRLDRAVYGVAANHAGIAGTLNNLGNVCQQLGQYEQAKDCYEQALAMLRVVYGATANHVHIATALLNLGRVYLNLGQYDQAMNYYEQALAMQRAVYRVAANHASIASTLNNLGMVYRRLGDYEQAKDYLEQALAMYRAVYGETTNGADITDTLNNLGLVYNDLGKYDLAKDYLEQALAMYRAVYGVTANHASIAGTLNNLGNVYDDLGDFEKAKDYLEQALAMKRAVYGGTANHASIASTLGNLGNVYKHLGQYEQAKDYYEQTLAMERAVYGVTANHASIAETLQNLGAVFSDLGQYDQAKDYHEQALAMQRAVYGATANHAAIAMTLNNLGAVYFKLNDYDKTKDYYEQALNMYRIVYQGNESHPHIEICLSILQLLRQAGL